MLCLSDEQVKELVENGQLSSNELFSERMRTMQKMMGMNVKGGVVNKKISKSSRINELEEMLNDDSLTKNQKKNIKKKIKKQKEKENDMCS